MDKLKQSFEIIVNEIERLDSRIDSLSGGGNGDLPSIVLPRGIITMWSGAIADIPSGWVLCDGSNGTPDLRDRFIVGAGGSYNVGDTGGAKEVTLTIAQMPSHNHTANSDTAGEHTHEYNGWASVLTAGSGTDTSVWSGDFSSNTSSAGGHNHAITVNNTGSGQAHENRPPYYALAYIMKL